MTVWMPQRQRGGDGVATPSAFAQGALAIASVGTVLAVAAFAQPAPAIALAGFGFVAALVLAGLRRSGLRAPFGLANTVTLARSGMIAVLLGFAATTASPESPLWWLAVALAATALLLDGVDGWIARRSGRVTAFGARFDMEVDAAFALVAALVLWQADKTGAWVLLVGSLRYLFMLAGFLYAPLRRPLPASQRRRAVCALQGALFCAALAPIVSPMAAAILVAMALAATALSFAADLVWLWRRRSEEYKR